MEAQIKKQLQAKLRALYKNKAEHREGHDLAFPNGYLDEHSLKETLKDLDYMSQLSSENPLEIALYQTSEKNEQGSGLHLRLFQWHDPLALSDILPMLENFNLRTERERVYKIRPKSGQHIFVSDFSLNYPGDIDNMETQSRLFQEAFSKVFLGLAENDGLNKLILAASLSWREVSLLRTYTKYLLQIGTRFSQTYMEQALVTHPLIAFNLVALFKRLNDPDYLYKKDRKADMMEQTIQEQLEQVKSLDEDKIISNFIELIKATLRTNYFQRTNNNELSSYKEYIAIKLDSSAIRELPRPKPLFEIFVYSPKFEGIHLRKERIARGGLRWSDRREDFRSEVLGLMKAQVVKNTVIVPSGAKGGFVLKNVPQGASREEILRLGIRCYQWFISGLLDITDNIKDGKCLPPSRVVCHDEPDSYLVVAADKGTASFSDIANALSKKYDFWLGDAFASGGSQGYDHKKMGITARGAWESVKRHFRELELDVEEKAITVVGIGDMSGDVFGNGMLYSNRINLLAAFDHRHIFIDPNPSSLEASYLERERLFHLTHSSWEDYSPQCISKGGGVFSRALKSITITPQMKEVFGISANNLTPNELIMALLKAPVDLLFNGGIGTYVKSSLESHANVGDRANEFCRVNGNQLRCKVVAEGGNMGLTQLGRIEYSENGGLIYTDFIDNSAGVDCSDHEVNLKILLDIEMEKGLLKAQNRNTLLGSLIEEVAALVLNDNRAQALVLSFSAATAKKNIALHTTYIKFLEEKGLLNREDEFLPNEKELAERKAAGLGLTRPELAILLAYTKIYVKKEILASNLPEDPYFIQMLESAFPYSIRKRNHKKTFQEHRLKREIVATQLGNELVNHMGITFIYRMQLETGAKVDEIVRAFIIAFDSFETQDLEQKIESLDFKIDMADQFEMLRVMRRLVNLSTRWFLNGKYHEKELEASIKHFNSKVKQLKHLIPELMSGITKQYMQELLEKFGRAKLPKVIAEKVSSYRAIYTALNIIELATLHHLDLETTARIYFAIGERMKLVWFRDELANDTRDDYWHALTRLTLRDELDILQKRLTLTVLKGSKNTKTSTQANIKAETEALVEQWILKNERVTTRWNEFLSQLHGNSAVDYNMFFIAIHELTNLIQDV